MIDRGEGGLRSLAYRRREREGAATEPFFLMALVAVNSGVRKTPQ